MHWRKFEGFTAEYFGGRSTRKARHALRDLRHLPDRQSHIIPRSLFRHGLTPGSQVSAA